MVTEMVQYSTEVLITFQKGFQSQFTIYEEKKENKSIKLQYNITGKCVNLTDTVIHISILITQQYRKLLLFRLPVVPHFSSGIVEGAKRKRA